MQPREIARQRLRNQHLARPTLDDVHAIVSTLGAVQAQDYLAAKWAVGLRGKGVTDAAVERAMAEGTIVRTHVLRPTWHFVAPEDIRWMLELTAARVKRAMNYNDRNLGLDDATYRRGHKALAKALEGGRALTRAEITEVYRRAKIDVSNLLRVGHLLMRAELDALICSGPRRGKWSTYALIDERVKAAAPRPRDDALSELARRYFATRGPATLQDFAWWSGLTVSDGKRAVSILGNTLESRTIDGRTYWHGADAPVSSRKPDAAHLLPNFDEFFVGFRDRSAIYALLREAGRGAKLPTLPGNVVVLDGQVVAEWKRVPTPRASSVEITPLAKLGSEGDRAVTRAVKRLGEFLGQPVTVI